MRTRTRLATTTSILAAVLLVAGCGARPDHGPDARSVQTAAATSGDDVERDADAASRAAVDIAPLQTDADAWWWLDSAPSDDAALTPIGAHAETHDGVDRLVLDLTGTGAPGWSVEHVETATDEESGYRVDVAADQYVLLRLAGMAPPIDENGQSTQLDPQVLDVGGPALGQVAIRPWFGGVVNVFLGVRGDADPAITVAFDAAALRLTVDVAHP
ncbi:AMIN-like domain-containing (lipo)protein [Xylanimonas ulmi]|uniref:AMIN-like domain-containing protein n=1 Tax=Xylanimonas ulmi TaxID=228973 RepID=A0A4Q7M4H9_9MICO|nr:hypothetical protein [Xylanibacterium ulmi]RZS62494.1 hypothetical protein EV386_2830 [Xylanibacterium ulmi]